MSRPPRKSSRQRKSVDPAPADVNEDDGDFGRRSQTEAARHLESQPPPLPRARRPRAAARPTPPPLPVEDDDFGAGIVDEAVAAETVPAEPTPRDREARKRIRSKARRSRRAPKAANAKGESQGRGRRGRGKAQRPPHPQEGRRRRGRRRARRRDDKPKYMGGAERRTSADDEPEIAALLRGFGDRSTPMRPNDRFAAADEAPATPRWASTPNREIAEAAEEEARTEAHEAEGFFESPAGSRAGRSDTAPAVDSTTTSRTPRPRPARSRRPGPGTARPRA